ncbi:muellerian-inhibiting factor [Elgaria multicarinata webbii]|uniref:muellerian-inhibiting factor n=1 Tax=Elgaria multicarinata webbii TaxID=159646 RepID=UPI002FCCCC90
MKFVLAEFVLCLSLVTGSIPVPGKKNLLGKGPQGESGPSAFRESKPPEEEDVTGVLEFGGPLGGVNPEDDQPHQRKRLWLPGSSFEPWFYGSPEEPMCRVKLDGSSTWGPNHLEVMGLLTSYDSGFLKALSRTAWSEEDLEVFGMCPTDALPSLLTSLQRVSHYLANPGENRFLLLHLEEVKWEAETKLKFKLTVQEEVEASLVLLQLALLVFYQGGKDSAATTPRQKFLVSGAGLHQQQAVCLTRDTRYIVLWGSMMSGRRVPRQLSFELSLEIRHQNITGAALSSQEAQDLLFGFDAKCFTRMTPAVLLMVKQRLGDTVVPPPSFLAADGTLDVVPYLKPSSLQAAAVAGAPSSDAASPSQTKGSGPVATSTGEFLEALSRFVNKVLRPSGESRPASRVHLRLDSDTMEALPHVLLNLSEKVALEQLVQSDDHLVVLFPEDSQNLMEHHPGLGYLEGTLLQQLLEKLQSVIQQLNAMPSFRANAELFHTLLAFCYYPSSGPAGLSSSTSGGTEGSRTRGKIHSLLLLKALQVVRARWRESKASSRANRSAQNQEDYCRLQELRIDLVSTGYVMLPNSYNANNCVGPCRSPLSTRISDYYSHTVFLLHMHEQGLPLRRAPCCVPEKYSPSHMVTFTHDHGMIVKLYPNMVAVSCGCR